MRIAVRHIEANGIGYDKGYTTLEAFLSPSEYWCDCWMPFLDVRGHIFNDEKLAANIGIGARFLSSRVWGINAYYDYRNTHHQSFNQISVGLESLGTVWDFRINGYLPVGDTKSSFFRTRFDEFHGNHMILKRTREFAMRGVNAEVGIHLNQIKNVPIYFAAGPYFFNDDKDTAWGGQLRAVIDFSEYVRIEGNTSYDNVFKWIGQGQISLIFPFGRRKEVRKRKCYTCCDELLLSERMVQRVDRNEIIVVDKKHIKSTAIDPLTGEPYFFWFVDNTSHSNGTIESPFNTLLAAQNASSVFDVIYVFPGNGTTLGMDQGFVMKNNQKIFGSGIDNKLATTKGEVAIPAQTENFPLITNTILNTAAITLANNCEVAGLYITATNGGDGILGGDPTPAGPTRLGIINTFVHNNIITNVNVTNGAIYLANCLGELIVSNNNISNITSANFSSGINIFYQFFPVNSASIITNNIVLNAGFFGIFVESFFSPSSHIVCIAEDNFVSICNQSAFLLAGLGDSLDTTICGKIRRNVFERSADNGLTISTSNAANINVEISYNRLNGNGNIGFEAHTFNSSTICVQMFKNISDNGFNIFQFDTSTLNAASLDEALSGIEEVNQGPVMTTGTINFVPFEACDCE